MLLLLLACLTPDSYLAESSRIYCENASRCAEVWGDSSVETNVAVCMEKWDAVHPTVCRSTHFDAESAQSCLDYLEGIDCEEYYALDANSGCADVCLAIED